MTAWCRCLSDFSLLLLLFDSIDATVTLEDVDTAAQDDVNAFFGAEGPADADFALGSAAQRMS